MPMSGQPCVVVEWRENAANPKGGEALIQLFGLPGDVWSEKSGPEAEQPEDPP